MIEILRLGADHILGYRIDGRVEAPDVDRLVNAADRKLASHDKLCVYAEVQSLTGLTLEAIVRDLEATVRRLNWFTRFHKVAVVTDAAWLRTVARVEDVLFRGIQIRAFSLNEKEAALTWLEA
jgi:hypothetical protein